MSKVLCFDARSVLRCSLPASSNTLRIIPTDSNKFSLPLDSHVYLLIEADGLREEVRFNGGPSFGGNLTVERGDSRQSFPAGASVCVAITCGYLNDFVCQRVKQCATDTATGLGELLPLNNTWNGTNVFTRPVSFGGATWDQELVLTNRLLSVTSGLWVNFSSNLNQEQYGYLSTVIRTAGTKETFGGKFSARGQTGVTGVVIGGSSEAWTAPGAQSPLTGAQSLVYSQESNSTAEKIGQAAVFNNRPSGASTTVNGLGANKYNQNSVAYVIASQDRSSAGEFCGWSRGIVFRSSALDEVAGKKAVGIDFSDIDTAQIGRIESWIRFKFDAGIEWNGDSVAYDRLKSAFNRTTSEWGFTWKGNNRFGFRVDNGTLIFADTGSITPLLATAAGAASGKFLPVEVNGIIYKIELRGV